MLDLNIITKSVLGIFFLYLVMFGSYINVLLNCNLQRFLQRHIFMQHFIVFFSIFIFTFVLNWYTPKSMVLEEFSNMDNILKKYNYLFSSLGYSLLIYIIFILSTKQEVFFMFTFLVLLIAIIGIYIIYRVELSNLNIEYTEIKKNLFTNTDKMTRLLNNNKKNLNSLQLTSNLHNAVSVGYIVLIINILLGVSFYFKRQRKEHFKTWNWLTFFFGNNKCREN